MAQDIDPNNLDSIDALLDEAEIDELDEEPKAFEEDTPDEASDVEMPEMPDLPDQESLDEPESPAEDDEDFANLLDDVINPAEEQQDIAESPNQEEAAEKDKEDEEFARMLADREQNFKSNNSNELTVEEMDTLKKLIIGFSSALIVLVLIAMGFALWAALGVSGQKLPDEGVFEDLIGETELSRSLAQSSDETLQDLNKKLDALSFQIEQIGGDLLNLDGNKLSAANNSKDELDLMPQKKDPKPEVKPADPAPQVAQQAAPQVDSAQLSRVDKKIDSLTRSLSLAQRRVVEINNRVKSLQQQYTGMLQSVKRVEKTQLENQVAKKPEPEEILEEEPKETKPASSVNENAPYSYKASDGGLGYDPSSNNVYP